MNNLPFLTLSSPLFISCLCFSYLIFSVYHGFLADYFNFDISEEVHEIWSKTFFSCITWINSYKYFFLKWYNNSRVTFGFRHTLALAASYHSMRVISGTRVLGVVAGTRVVAAVVNPLSWEFPVIPPLLSVPCFHFPFSFFVPGILRGKLLSSQWKFSPLLCPHATPLPFILLLLKVLCCQATKVRSGTVEGQASAFTASSGRGESRGASHHGAKTDDNREILDETPQQTTQKSILTQGTRWDGSSTAETPQIEKDGRILPSGK